MAYIRGKINRRGMRLSKEQASSAPPQRVEEAPCDFFALSYSWPLSVPPAQEPVAAPPRHTSHPAPSVSRPPRAQAAAAPTSPPAQLPPHSLSECPSASPDARLSGPNLS